MKKKKKFWYYFCTWWNGTKEFGAIFTDESPSPLQVSDERQIQSWITLYGPFPTERDAIRAKEQLQDQD